VQAATTFALLRPLPGAAARGPTGGRPRLRLIMNRVAAPADWVDRPAAASAVAAGPQHLQLESRRASAAQGNGSAFEAFYDASFSQARATARRLLRGADIEDLLSEAYFEAWRNAARFDPSRGSALAWLLTIVRSRALDLLRRNASHPSVGGSQDRSQDSNDDAAGGGYEGSTELAADPAEQLWRHQAGSRLHGALADLSAPERWVLGLAYFQDMSHGQIAERTGMPLGTVKSHALRAHQKLRVALSDGRPTATNDTQARA
jgi:RNA polymerase sigma-70 factor, ECF subfamily